MFSLKSGHRLSVFRGNCPYVLRKREAPAGKDRDCQRGKTWKDKGTASVCRRTVRYCSLLLLPVCSLKIHVSFPFCEGNRGILLKKGEVYVHLFKKAPVGKDVGSRKEKKEQDRDSKKGKIGKGILKV